MKKLLIFSLLALLVGCADVELRPAHPSPLDGINNSAGSWHRAHVLVEDDDDFILDDGTWVKLFFTGGTAPHRLERGWRGTLYVSVPSYEDDDDRNTYYFQKFVPDKDSNRAAKPAGCVLHADGTIDCANCHYDSNGGQKCGVQSVDKLPPDGQTW